MSRKSKKLKREYRGDSRFNSPLVTRLINAIMVDGKKSTAERIVYNAIDTFSERVKGPQLESVEKAIDNVRPLMEVKSRRVGGATYQVPIEVQKDRSISLALRWIGGYSRKKKGGTMALGLSNELTDAFSNGGDSAKKREDTHKMAEANKAFSHYRW